jgi:predicted DNA-binding transcriptional regulator AlpA
LRRSTSPADDTLLTPAEFADRERVDIHTVYRWNLSGRGPAYIRIGGRKVRYRLSDVLAWEQANLIDKRAEGWA